MKLVLSFEQLHCLGQVTLIQLWFTDEHKIWLVGFDEKLQAGFISSEAFDVPSDGGESLR